MSLGVQLPESVKAPQHLEAKTARTLIALILAFMLVYVPELYNSELFESCRSVRKVWRSP
jgi:hypothetical protein